MEKIDTDRRPDFRSDVRVKKEEVDKELESVLSSVLLFSSLDKDESETLKTSELKPLLDLRRVRALPELL